MFVIAASSSVHRQSFYRAACETLGHRVGLAANGIDCLEQLRQRLPDALILEAPLLWGGSDGILDVLQSELLLGSTERRWLPVIVVAIGAGTIDWFQLSRFKVDDILFRLPTLAELDRAIKAVTAPLPSASTPAQKNVSDSARGRTSRLLPPGIAAPQPASGPHWQWTGSVPSAATR